MNISIPLFPYDRWPDLDALLSAVREVDRLGYHSVSFPEHFVMPAVEGVDPVSAVWYDNFVLGAAIASVTENLRLVFNVCIIPYRHPVELAKLTATLDVVSHGRLVLVAGTGWMRREFNMLGIPYDDRGLRTDDALRAMKTLWTQSTPSYEGSHFSIPPVHFLPVCAQRPHVPIWIGGNGPRPFRRAVELGDGWIPLAGTEAEIEQAIVELSAMLETAGRDPGRFTFGYSLAFSGVDDERRAANTHVAHGRSLADATAASPAEAVDAIGRLRNIGVNHLVLQFPWRTVTEFSDVLAYFESDVLRQLPTHRRT